MDIHIVIGRPAAEGSKGIVLAKAGGGSRMALVTWQRRVEAEEGHGGGPLSPHAGRGGGGGGVGGCWGACAAVVVVDGG